MSIDVIERRRAVEERLRRARNLAQAVEQAIADVVSDSGQTIQDLDPDSSLRTAVTTLAGVTALRPGFDILVSLPNLPFSLRLRHLADSVDIALVRPEDIAAGLPTGPDLPEPRNIPRTPDSDLADADPEGHVASDLAAMLWQDVGESPL